jgi:hypothetical protein
MSFVKCLAYGKTGEKLAKTFFTDYDELVDAPDGKFSFWDFYVRYKDKKKYYEVKKDSYTTRTGNMCIEFESNGKASGISITTADYYIYLVEGEEVYYMIPVETIRSMIEDGKYHKKQKGGYKWLAHFYLFKRELFEDCKRTYSVSS